MRRKNILIAGLITTLLMGGCVQKKTLESRGVKGLDRASVISGSRPVTNNTVSTIGGYEDNTRHYDNVDPYGSGNYGSNGRYETTIGGNENINSYNGGQYTDNSNGYGNGVSGVKNIYFGLDEYAITSDKLPIVSRNARLLRGKDIKIEGHCDASGSDEYNYALGLRRAQATKDALVLNGIPENRISLMSMGESSPECTTSSSASCYAKNRRVEFKAF